jgi:arginyl-tRNA--protein-N-Asp/Glu arginylyltransferase
MVRPAFPLPLLLSGDPPELVVYDEPQRCPYLPGRVARMPLRLPARALRGSELDQRLALGDRRQGFVLYRTACATCRACEPVRVLTEDFRLTRSLRRVLRKGDSALRMEMGPPEADAERVALYNLHKATRGLADGQPPIDLGSYREFLSHTCCDSFELRFYAGSELVAVSVVDRGQRSLSAVYCYYDPGHAHLSLGTYAILKEIELCRRWRMPLLYLGLYIAQSPVMRYKSRFLPQQRLQGGLWRDHR